MPNTDSLFTLIQSLTKAEKRYFSLYISRQQSSESAKFKQLFDVLEKMNQYEEEVLLRKLPSVKPSQLGNLKAHLYYELMTSLRLFHLSKNMDIQIREQIDFARILYNRGLVLQSLKVLDKAKALAKANSHFILTLEIIQLEQNIEARHITRSLRGRAESLHEEKTFILQHVNEVANLSSLALRMYGIYLEKGHVHNVQESRDLEKFFKEQLGSVDAEGFSFFSKAYLHQAFCWYYYVQLDFPNYYRHAMKWVELFDDNPKAKTDDPFLYLKAVHNLVNALFSIGKHAQLREMIGNLEEFYIDAINYNENLQVQTFVYLYTAKLNYFFLTGDFTEGLSIIPEIENQLREYQQYIDTHRIMVFYYKIACLYFGAGKNEDCIAYLNKIINLKVGHLRSDLQSFARLLHLIAHYELGTTEILEYLIKSVYRYMVKMSSDDAVQTEILRFLRRSLSSRPRDVVESFLELRDKLKVVSMDKYARRSYQYLDIISWLESKINNKPVEEVIKEKFLQLEKKELTKENNGSLN